MIGLIAPFQILDYLERLKVVKETSSEYHCLCPVCGDGGFKVNKKNGSYQAFKCGCEVKDIREAVRPWSKVQESQSNNFVQPQPKKTASNSSLTFASNIEEVSLARLDSPAENTPQAELKVIPEWLQSQGVPSSALETRYWYSKTQWVSRFEWTTPEGKAKTIRQGHIKSNGLREWKKGSKDWRAYRLSEAVKYCQDKWVLSVEGEGCVETARAKAIAGITWQGSNWKEKAIISDLKALKQGGAAGLVYFPDRDETGEKKAELVLSACEQVNLPCLILSPTDVWAEMPVKGDITDFVEAHPNLSTDELTSRLSSAIGEALEADSSRGIQAPPFEGGVSPSQKLTVEPDKKGEEILKELPNWSQSDLARWLAEKYRSKLAWNTEKQEWYRYSAVTEGIWSIEPIEFVGQLVKSEVEAIATEIAQTSKNQKKPSYSISFINGVTALLKMDLAVRKWREVKGVIPMLNGVLDLKTRKLLAHSPQNQLTWCLPYAYNILATCDPIQNWLLEMYRGDRDLVELMRAYLLGIITGRTDWQKYIELIGPGGAGKSTFTRLAIALVGQENVHTTTLKKLEGEKFESASIAGKRLVIINDSERYAGEVGKLKNLTGQDTLPYEVKYQQSKGGFNPDALVIVSTNEVIQSSDYTSGLARRRISIPMLNLIKSDRQKNLIEHQNGELLGEFVPYIPGLLNWVLAMDEGEATRIVKNYETAVPSLLAMKATTLVETNPIADWLDHKVVYDHTAKTNIGVAKRDKDNNSDQWYLNTDRWLYASYAEHCHDTGTRALSLRRFVNLLSDLGKNQLGLDLIRERDRYGSYFVGLKIRTEEDDKPPMITGEKNLSLAQNTQPANLNNTNVVNRIWTMVIDKITTAIEKILDDGLGSHRPHGGQPGVTPGFRGGKLETETKQEQSRSPERESNVETESSNYLRVGDRVTITDCPGHWSWASPFTVRAIESNLVALELVDELIEMSRLKKCC
jgi:putative DNA primase/helicase